MFTRQVAAFPAPIFNPPYHRRPVVRRFLRRVGLHTVRRTIPDFYLGDKDPESAGSLTPFGITACIR
jgi:hypothetical protein